MGRAVGSIFAFRMVDLGPIQVQNVALLLCLLAPRTLDDEREAHASDGHSGTVSERVGAHEEHRHDGRAKALEVLGAHE